MRSRFVPRRAVAFVGIEAWVVLLATPTKAACLSVIDEH